MLWLPMVWLVSRGWCLSTGSGRHPLRSAPLVTDVLIVDWMIIIDRMSRPSFFPSPRSIF